MMGERACSDYPGTRLDKTELFSEQRSFIAIRNFSDVPVRLVGSLSSTWCADEISFLDQEWFVHFLNGSGFFTYCSRNGGDAYWSALELFDDGRENADIHLLESILVDIQCLQCELPNIHVHQSIVFALIKEF